MAQSENTANKEMRYFNMPLALLKAKRRPWVKAPAKMLEDNNVKS